MASQRATKIDLFSLATPQMKAFHLTWLAFFVCFFAWFAVAPLMSVIKNDYHLTPIQIANINIAAVGITILGRIIVGPLCDRYGPRRTYTALLAFGAIPVLGIAFAWSYASFLMFRLAIGIIGASFVITQYHTSVMFAPNVVGTANATAGGWGNAGGGVTQTVMPLVLTAILGFGVTASFGWRLSMILPGVLMLLMAVLYWRFTQDTPEGDIVDLRRLGIEVESGKRGGWHVMKEASKNYRVWVLAACYGASFGVELFIHGVAATYYSGRFHLDVVHAGYAAGSFGLLALFARALGGILSDRVARWKGLDGRAWLLSALLLGEGIGLLAFSKAGVVGLAILTMLGFGLFTHMACGAIYALVPFVDRKVLGGVAGIVGAGGNVGGVAAGFLLRGTGSIPACLFILGWAAVLCAVATVLIRFTMAHKQTEQKLYDQAMAERLAATEGRPIPAMA
jgi:NNP family nitrate/nitrite transporter-like MFS transporter